MPPKPAILDLSQRDVVSKFNRHPSLLVSHSANWQGLYLEFHRLPASEVPEFSSQQYRITIPTKAGSQIEQRLDGKYQQFIYRLQAIEIIPIDVRSQYRCHQEISLIQLSLEPELVNHAIPELMNPDQIEIIPQPYIDEPLIYQLGLALKAELEHSGVTSKLYADSSATFLAAHLVQHYAVHKPKHKGHTGGLSQRQLRQAVDYIEAHIANEICLDEMANYLGFSRYYFCRLFKQSTGLSPYKYVTQCRVERAKKLLKRGGLTLAEVALACGFSHQSHLNRHFKRITGVTPKRFINS